MGTFDRLPHRNMLGRRIGAAAGGVNANSRSADRASGSAMAALRGCDRRWRADPMTALLLSDSATTCGTVLRRPDGSPSGVVYLGPEHANGRPGSAVSRVQSLRGYWRNLTTKPSPSPAIQRHEPSQPGQITAGRAGSTTLWPMDDPRLGRLIRLLRQRRGWRQVDLARTAGVGRSVVSDMELGRLNGMSVATLRRVAAAFSLTLEGTLRGLGADADRLLDQRHAALVEACAAWLARLGWQTIAEASYSEWGERGSVDLLAWHPASGSLLVVEVKSELASLEETLRKHGEKVRLATAIARPLGWHPVSLGRLLVLPEDRTERRRVQAHDAVLRAAYPCRGRTVRAWCRSPNGPLAGLVFLTNSAGSGRIAGSRRRRRVRLAASDETAHTGPATDRSASGSPGPIRP